MGRDLRTERYQQQLSEHWQDKMGGNDLGDNPDKYYIRFMKQIPGVLPSTITAKDHTCPFTKRESRYYHCQVVIHGWGYEVYSYSNTHNWGVKF